MDKTPIQYEPISRWRVVLHGAAEVALFILAAIVIITPTVLMVLIGAQ